MPIACSVRTDHRNEASAACARLRGGLQGEGGRLSGAVRASRPRSIEADRAPAHETRTCMGSNKKKKTTMAKLNRETALRERRLQKQARKDARRQAAEAQRSDPSSDAAGERA